MLYGYENQQTVESLVSREVSQAETGFLCLESRVSREISQPDGFLVVLGFLILT